MEKSCSSKDCSNSGKISTLLIYCWVEWMGINFVTVRSLSSLWFAVSGPQGLLLWVPWFLWLLCSGDSSQVSDHQWREIPSAQEPNLPCWGLEQKEYPMYRQLLKRKISLLRRSDAIRDIFCGSRVEVVFFPFYNEMKWRKMGVLCFIFPTLPPTTIKCRIKDWFIYFVLIFENVLVEFSLSGLEFRRVWFFLMLCLLCVSAVWC